jgi:hypothetical protein
MGKSNAQRREQASPVPGARNAQAPAMATVGRPSRQRTYGYSFQPDGVLFEFELTDETNLVTNGRTGVRSRFLPDRQFRVGVAIDVTTWVPQPMRPNPRSPRQFQLLIPYSQFTAPEHQFKFVIDDDLWVEAPTFASNVAPTGVAADTFNLVLSLRARPMDDTGWLKGVSDDALLR